MISYGPVVTRVCIVNEDQLKETISTFDQAADQYLKHFQHYAPYHGSYEAFLAALNPNQQHILELGCGPGQVSQFLLNKRPDLKILGIDLVVAGEIGVGVPVRISGRAE